MEKKLPEFLKQVTTGRIYKYHAGIADRQDMQPYDPPKERTKVSVRNAGIPNKTKEEK